MSLVEKLYRLQQVDIKLQESLQGLDEVEKQLSDDTALVATESRLTSEKEQLADVKKRQKNCEWELEDIQQKVNKFKNKLYNGKTQNPKELVNIESEIKSLKNNVSKREDELLGIMTQVEELEVKVKYSTEEFEHLKQDWQQRQEVLKQRKTELEAEIAKLSENHDGQLQQIDSETIRLYKQIKLTKGQAVVKVEKGRCQGCHITLPTSQWQRARIGDLVQCNSCSRILYVE